MGELGDRKKKILKAIVDDYIGNAEPVGSKTLQGKLDFKVSTATLRNEMSDLEEMGYLEQPHTSAGRIPTPRGYRLYVDELMAENRMTVQEMEMINRQMREKMDQMDQIIAEAGRMISQMTHYTTYAMTRSAPNAGSILHFDLLVHNSSKVILVLVTERHEVKSTMLKCEAKFDQEDLFSLSRALNQYLSGIRGDQIDEGRLRAVINDGGPLAGILLPQILHYLAEIHRKEANGEFYLTGAGNLLSHPEYQDLMKAQEIMDYLSDKKIATQLPIPASPGEMQFLIGPENVAEQLKNSSVVMASYQLGDGMQGLIGVVGPTRMDYAKVASRLAYFAKKLSELFKEGNSEQEENKT